MISQTLGIWGMFDMIYLQVLKQVSEHDLDVLKKIQQDDGVGDLGQDMFEAVNLIDPTDEEVDPAVNR